MLLGNGDGTFQEPINTTLSGGPEAIAAGYFKGDSNLDLAVTETFPYSDTVQILLGNGDGTFSLGNSYDSGPSTLSIVAADLRNDGKTDLVAAESGGMGVEVLLGNGDGTFQPPVVYEVNTSLAAAVGDMNGDGIPDMVALSVNNSGSVAVLLGSGNGTFGSPQYYYPTGEFPRALALADFNGDGQLDVALADQLGDRDYVLLNTGPVAFSPSGPMSFGSQQHGTTSAAKIVMLANTGKIALEIHSIKAQGQFGVASSCGASVAANASCTVSITFSPTSAGAKIGTIEINDSASTKPQVIALSGTGT